MENEERDYTTKTVSVNTNDLNYIKDNDLSATVLLRQAIKIHREGEKEQKRLIKLNDFRDYLMLLGISIIVLMFSTATNDFLLGMGGFIIFIALMSFIASNILAEGVRYYRRKQRV